MNTIRYIIDQLNYILKCKNEKFKDLNKRNKNS